MAAPGVGGASGPARADVPLLVQSPAVSLPSDATEVRVAMTENNTASVMVSSSGGVSAPGATGADAVMFVPAGNGVWTVSVASSCTGPWTQVQGAPVATPLAAPATSGDDLTLCADDGNRATDIVVQGTVKGVYNSNGQARTVNTVPLEEYVADVVPGESISSWGTVGAPGPQAHPWGFQELEAQAVAARSYVLASPGGYGGYATTCDLFCQTYRGMRYLTANSAAAAQDTAGQVMVMPSGSVASTEYSASTGGYTSSSAEGSPFTPVPDTGDGVCLTPPPAGFSLAGVCNPSHDWSVTVGLTQVHAHWPSEGTTPTVTVSGRNGEGTWGGRVTQVTIAGNGASQVVTAATFVAALSLKSTYFTITSQPGQALQTTGHGWGHGVGMGQWGAFGYAVGTDNGQGNWTWQQIVDHYYAPATIETLPGAPTPTPPATSTFDAFTRVYGATADATAAAELEHQFAAQSGACPGTATTRPVVLATDANYPDALASAPLAAALRTGTLLTPTGGLSSATAAAIKTEGITKVVVVGGPLAVSTAVVTALAALPAYACGGKTRMSGHLSVTRISGQTAYTTAADIATTATKAGVPSLDLAGAYRGTNALGGEGRYNATAGAASAAPSAPGSLATAILATGEGFQDAESASALAYAARLPILLTTRGSLSSQAATWLGAHKVAQVLVMGGPFAVATAVVTALESRSISVLRVAGQDDVATAVELATLEEAAAPTGLGWRGTGDLTTARGDFFTDGLAGAVVAAGGPASTAPEPLLLTQSPTSVGSALAAFLHLAGTSGVGGKNVGSLTVLGGPEAVTPTTVQAMGSDL